MKRTDVRSHSLVRANSNRQAESRCEGHSILMNTSSIILCLGFDPCASRAASKFPSSTTAFHCCLWDRGDSTERDRHNHGVCDRDDRQIHRTNEPTSSVPLSTHMRPLTGANQCCPLACCCDEYLPLETKFDKNGSRSPALRKERAHVPEEELFTMALYRNTFNHAQLF